MTSASLPTFSPESSLRIVLCMSQSVDPSTSIDVCLCTKPHSVMSLTIAVVLSTPHDFSGMCTFKDGTVLGLQPPGGSIEGSHTGSALFKITIERILHLPMNKVAQYDV